MHPIVPVRGTLHIASDGESDADAFTRLIRLTELLAAAVAEHREGIVAGYRVTPTGVDVFHLSGTDVPGGPSTTLLGRRAPSDWAAVAVLALGTARDLDRSNPRRALVGHVQLRDGRWISLLGPAEGPWDVITDGEQPVGRVPDAARRLFGLPTTVPVASTLTFWAARWLLTLLQDPGAVTTWDDVVAAFPAVLGPTPADPVQLVDAGRELAQEVPWSMLRRVCSRGRVDLPGLDPELAAWMDDGMFARWACEQLGPPTLLVEMLEERLPIGLARRVRWALGAWGLDSWYPHLTGETIAPDAAAN